MTLETIPQTESIAAPLVRRVAIINAGPNGFELFGVPRAPELAEPMLVDPPSIAARQRGAVRSRAVLRAMDRRRALSGC
jgi:hypothetical protein